MYIGIAVVVAAVFYLADRFDIGDNKRIYMQSLPKKPARKSPVCKSWEHPDDD